jgi:sugar-specific transcriptional regulator TrmB
MDRAIDALVKLGLTEMEARIYTFLLGENPATGYRIAGVVGKPVANIYKSIKSLEKKGAVVIEEDKKRLCRPVKLKEFMSLLERRFKNQKETAETELSTLQSISEDDRVYQIRSVDEVLERCRFMLEDVEKIVIIDLFPDLLDDLREDIETCTKRGVKVFIKAYRTISIPNAHIILDSRTPDVMAGYPGQWLKIVIDGREHLLAFLDINIKAVHQAVWSSSRFLSLMHHYGMVSEMLLDRIGETVTRKGGPKEIHNILSEYSLEKKLEVPGHIEFINGVKNKSIF